MPEPPRPRNPVKGRTGGLSATPVFDLTLEIRGAVRPGVPIQVFGEVRGQLPSSDADLRLSLPEAAEAETRGPRAFEVPVGPKVSPAAARRGPVARGQLRRLHTSVTIPDPGYYRVSLTAVDTTTPEEELRAASDGGHVQSHTRLQKWIFVSEEGGQVTERFRSELIPDSLRPQPGPFRTVKEDGGPVDRSGEQRDDGGVIEASVAPWLRAGMDVLRTALDGEERPRRASPVQPYRYRLVHWDGNTFRPVEGALVRVAHVPEINNLNDAQDVVRVTKRTDNQGRFTVDCFVGRDHFTVDVRARAPGFTVVPERFGRDAGDYVDCGNGENLDRQLIAHSNQAHLFGNMRDIVPAS